MSLEKNKINNTNENNNNLFKKIIFNQNKIDNQIKEENTNNLNIVNSNMNSNRNSNNLPITENSMNASNNNLNNNIKIKNNNYYDNNCIKIILDTKLLKRDNKWNLTQKRYEKFMNINQTQNNNINNINTKESNNILINSKKLHRANNSKKHSLNEARYKKKIKNEINHDKRRDLSVELNHINAENFINGFKGMKLKQNELPVFDKTANNFKNNIILTQDTQNTNTTNTFLERNKGINNQNLTINMENNCQIETKENDSTNFKTDQSKILKTDDIYQDLVNSLKNAPFKFKHK
jgi:hypothetical protein